MKLILACAAIFLVASIQSIEAVTCPNVYFYFIGNSLTDIKNMTLGSSFSTLKSPHFTSGKKTVFYTGGWILDYTTFDAQTVLGAYLTNRRSDYNLVYIDWTYYTHDLFLIPLINQTNCVSRFIYQTMSQMQTQLSLDPAQTHFIGFNFGAHLLAYTARRFNDTKIARITGLDPGALLGFTSVIFNLFKFAPLKSGDASFVDIIHTSAGKFGFGNATADADFYVNGGASQKGCTLKQSLSDFKPYQDKQHAYLLVCSHARAVYYYAESVTSANTAARPFQSVRCPSETKEHNSDKCSDKSDSMSMGIYAAMPSTASGLSGSFFVATTSDSAKFSLN